MTAFGGIPEAGLEGSILDRFDLIAQRFPDRRAVEDEAGAITYAELRARVQAIASAVAAATEGLEGPVAVMARHDAGFAAAFLGVMAAGRAAVLLDAGHPAERNRRIAAHSGACAVAAANTLESYARDIFPASSPVIDLDAPAPAEPPPQSVRPRPEDLAYVLYTSGSTGAPKGVAHDHRTAVHDMLLFTDFAQVRPEDRLSVFYSSVISAVRRTLGALLNGASLHVLAADRLGAEGLVREVRARGITILVDVPTIFRRLAGATPKGERLESLRLVCLAGDRCDWSDYDDFLSVASSGAVFAISAGSTEVPGYARWRVDPAKREAGERLPVGRPLPGLRLWIERDDGSVAGDGEAGELVVASRFLARGYWQDPEATASSFRPDPEDPEGRVFHTGDLGLRRSDGLLVLIGRKDVQIKLRGHRIEPAEAEAALRACSGVADAAAVVRRDQRGRSQALVAYVELEPGYETLLPRHLMAKLAQVLPAHLAPSVILIVDALPRLMNFKIDRASLERLDAERVVDEHGRAADPVLDRMIEAFEIILPGAHPTPEDNLLSLGGDSLQAVTLALEIDQAFGVRVPGDVLRQALSIRELAQWMSLRLANEPPAGRTEGP